MAAWQIEEARRRLDDVIERARNEGPQTITREGAVCAVILSIEGRRASPPLDFKAYLLGGPKVDDFQTDR